MFSHGSHRQSGQRHIVRKAAILSFLLSYALCMIGCFTLCVCVCVGLHHPLHIHTRNSVNVTPAPGKCVL